MGVRLAEQRAADIKVLEGEIAHLKGLLVESEDLERLATFPEWKTLDAAYRKAFAQRVDFDADGAKERLLTQPMTPDEAVKLRETVMLYERDRANLEDFLGYPARVKNSLKELRQELDAAEMRLKHLKGESHG